MYDVSFINVVQSHSFVHGFLDLALCEIIITETLGHFCKQAGGRNFHIWAAGQKGTIPLLSITLW